MRSLDGSRTEPPQTLPQAGCHQDLATVHLDLDGTAQIFSAHGWEWKFPTDSIFNTGLPRALDVFERAGIHATLFVIAEELRDPRKRELLRDAVARGHAIASHSLTHRKLTALAHDEKRREIFESREQIAAALGMVAPGFRAPGFDIDRETFELLDDAGYAYDSSVFPTAAFARRLGVGRVADSPHPPLSNRRLLELPLPAYRPLPTPFHPSYSLVLGMWYFRIGMRRFRRTGAPLVLLFHLTDFADPLPRAQLPGWPAAFFTLSYLSRERKIRRCQQMLDHVRRHYAVVSTESLLDAHRAPHAVEGREA